MNLLLQNGEFIDKVAHRPWSKPNQPWIIYQEWNDVLFLHSRINPEILREQVPSTLDLEPFENDYWVSIVVFRLEKARPRFFPHIPLVSNFHEINVRTYVKKADKRGVFFLDIEAEKWISCKLANIFSDLNYRKSTIKREKLDSCIQIRNSKSKKNFTLDLEYKITSPIYNKSTLDKNLTELYSVYVAQKSGNLIRFQVHHKEWDLYKTSNTRMNLDYTLEKIHIDSSRIELAHYSPGVQVIAWNREYV